MRQHHIQTDMHDKFRTSYDSDDIYAFINEVNMTPYSERET